MGQAIQTQYSVAVSSKPEGETEIRRHPQTVDGLVSSPTPELPTIQKIWQNSVKLYGDRPCIWKRNAKREYKPKTYKEINDLGAQLASGILHLNLAPSVNEHQDLSLQLIGIYSKNRIEWNVTDIGCAYLYGMTIVPMYDTLGPENLSFCLSHSNIETIFCSSPSLDTLLAREDIGRVKTIITYDPLTDEQKSKINERELKVYTYEEIIQIGKENMKPLPELEPSNILTFSYTSGTTGNPKAAMLSHGNFASACGMFYFHPSIKQYLVDQSKTEEGLIHLSYLPMPHTYERICTIVFLHLGAQLYMYSGDVRKISEDLLDVQPTLFCSVPRFYDVIKAQLHSQPKMKQIIAEIATEAKIKNLNKYAIYDHALWDKLVFEKIKHKIFGKRIRILFNGSAPLSKDVQEFLQIVAGVPMIEGYGQTEAMGGSFMKYHTDPMNGHVGGPLANCEFKLRDIPEMNYFSTDKNDQGILCPRGEICLRGPQVFHGYYKDIKKTEEAVDKDGWLHTGDVGSYDSKFQQLRIIDRIKNIFKLSQGEYVAPEKIENIYRKARGIAEVFVYGDSYKSACVGVIVPEEPMIMDLAKKLEISGTFEELCNNKEIRKEVLNLVTVQGKQDKLFGFEQIKAVHLEPQSLAEKDCLSNTMKLQRNNAKKAFEKELEELYQGLE